MRVVVFGAGGRTGRLVVREALNSGHEVAAFVRTPAKVEIEHPKLALVQGDVRDAGRVMVAVEGAAAVLSVLGPTSNRPEYQVSQGMQHIVSAMQAHGVERLIISAGAGVRMPEDEPGLPDRLVAGLLKLTSRHVYDDMVRTVAVVRASGLAWTVVRVPRLTGGPKAGQVRAGYVGRGAGIRLSRADLASFMVQQLTDDTYLHQAPVISH
jgi:putative NADH-flavin reductase